MGEAELLHRLYTNAAAGGQWQTTGARAIPLALHDASSRVSTGVLAGLDDLLRKTQPAGKATAWVVRRFADRDAYTCVVASYPDLVRDADGRPGFLSHARLVRVSEPSLDVAALVEAAESFPIAEICATPEDQRLTSYVDLISGDERVTLRPAAAATLQELPRTVLEDVLIACLLGIGKRQRMRFALGASSIDDIATAWAAIPFALQRTSSWAIGADDSCAVDVIFTADGKPPARVATAALVESVQRYVDLLHAAPQQFSAILRNPNISTVVQLDEAVRATGKGEMQPRKNKGRSEEWEPLDADTIAEMKRQYDAMEQSLRHSVEQRFTSLETRQPSQRLSVATLWVPAVAVLSLLLSGASLYFALRPRGPVGVRPTPVADDGGVDRPSEPEVPAVEQSPAERAIATANGQWADALRDLLSADGDYAARAVAAAGSATALDPFASRIARGEDLKPEGRARLRLVLLDAIAAQSNPKVKVDGKLTDVDMNALKQRYDATSTADMELQSEIILRWMASLDR